ncbi:hypothetical protein BT96DRAFT_72115 [Gymnopus androsaceus JB14]|uniref:Uncharacterized protein n=1 Tax=Gymnopus androsaceus JB14 TaxID=1447944 RepID=A0A6A4HG17_9AGAR|nr:hypothetical protein BT96DRAFT_72115 [Gymnopus androsaceus JB14]
MKPLCQSLPHADTFDARIECIPNFSFYYFKSTVGIIVRQTVPSCAQIGYKWSFASKPSSAKEILQKARAHNRDEESLTNSRSASGSGSGGHVQAHSFCM